MVLVLGAPFASASDPLPVPETCSPTVDVWPVQGLSACTPRSCDPALECRFDAEPTTGACAANLTIAGETCQASLGVEAGRASEDTAFALRVDQSDGNVDAFNLPNAWVSPAVTFEGRAFGNPLGRTSVGAYRSDILTDGTREGPVAVVSPGPNRTWTEIGVFARHDGTFARDGVYVSLWFLDMMPDGCYVRMQSDVDDVDDVACPSFTPVWSAVPALP